MDARKIAPAAILSGVLALMIPVPDATAASTTTTSTSASSTTATTPWSSEATANMQSQGCDPEVVSQISQAQDAQIRAQVMMAHQLYDYISEVKRSAASCLTSLVPHIFFGLPTLGDLWSEIGNMVCSEINQMVDPTLGTLNAGISNFEGGLNNALYQNLSLGNGAINLGSIPMGFTFGSNGQILNSSAIVNSLYDNTLNGTFDYSSSASSYLRAGSPFSIYGNY